MILAAGIDFAYHTFKWHNEVKGVAAVHCVIIGFHAKDRMTGGTRGTGRTGSQGTSGTCGTDVPPVQTIAAAAQAILDSRAAHPNATLADHNAPLTMPPYLVKAHAHLDALVDKAYGLAPFCIGTDRVVHLFKIYAGKTAR